MIPARLSVVKSPSALAPPRKRQRWLWLGLPLLLFSLAMLRLGPSQLLAAPGDDVAAPEDPSTVGIYGIGSTRVAGGFSAMTELTHAGDERLFVVERAGRIRVIDSAASGAVMAEPYLDLRSQVSTAGGEQGLGALVFHPDYATNGYFYVNYTNLDGNTIISRFQVNPANPNRANPATESLIAVIVQPGPYHNGGQMVFGPDGYLYIGMGDGGPLFNDPYNHGQRGDVLLGKILRIDVNSGNPYSIPADNPFVNDSSVRNEIWALGLRNPWRFSFDSLTDELYIADVGNGSVEEIDFVAAGSGGGQNFGWRCFEGINDFILTDCQGRGFYDFPAYFYSHKHGCAVIGGYVYRGSLFPEFDGHYFLADFCQGWLRSIARNEQGGWTVKGIGATPSQGFTPSFGQGLDGELYVLDDVAGEVRHLVPQDNILETYMPANLSLNK